MPRPQLPEPDPDTVTVRLPDGTFILIRVDPMQSIDSSPLQRVLRELRIGLGD
ncbi:hypothetical protein [Streptomyces sp. NPDC059071]|uniref:hypothetical protein n=1 Tax=unclassified Streptomyces TaxID=2593676 RepID=UPI0036511716